MDGKEQTIIDIAKTIAWHHCDRKPHRVYPRTDEGKIARNDYFSQREYKTFIPAARGVLALIEGWSGRMRKLKYAQATQPSCS